MIPGDLLGLLCCPRSGQPFTLAGPEILVPLNARISQTPHDEEKVRSVTGAVVEQPLTEALLRLDRLVLYPIRDGIPVLLADEAIAL